MKQILSYTAGGLLVAWVSYIFVSPEIPVRVNRTCMPAGGIVRIFGTLVRIIDRDSGESLTRGTPQAVVRSCRSAVWYWAEGNKPEPKYPDSDPIFGSFSDTGSSPAPSGGSTQVPAPATAPGTVATSPAAGGPAGAAPAKTSSPVQDDDRL